jgi:hypothetical protein
MVLTGCSSSPEQQLVGKWQGDTSALGTAIKAAKLKADAPEVSGSDALRAAKAMGATALDLRKDKTLEFSLGGSTFGGSWSYDADRKEVRLELKSVESSPIEGAKESFKPETWLAHVNELGRLEVFRGNREAYDLYEQAANGKKTGLIVLSKG